MSSSVLCFKRPMCACGCGKKVRTYRKNFGWDKVIYGHGNRLMSEDAPLCACGCGKLVLWDKVRLRWNKYLNGHNWEDGMLSEKMKEVICEPKSDSHKLRIGLANTGKPRSEEYRARISLGLMGKYSGDKAYWYGKHIPESARLKIAQKSSEKVGELNPFFHKTHSAEAKAKMSAKGKERWQDEVWKELQLKKFVKGWMVRPTRPEQRFLDLCNKLQLPYVYNGDSGKLIVGGRIPDFYNTNGYKQVVEIFGRYWHGRPNCPYPRTDVGTAEHYTKLGWECIILWEDYDDESWIKEVMDYAR